MRHAFAPSASDSKPSPGAAIDLPEIVVSTLPPEARLPAELAAGLSAPDLVLDANYGSRTELWRQVDREVVAGDAMLEAQARASFDFWLAHTDAALME